ncbi:MAG: hypothetical protein AAF127_03715 [Pseudomonadota bacterium]
MAQNNRIAGRVAGAPLGAGLCMAAAVAMAASPASAAELPQTSPVGASLILSDTFRSSTHDAEADANEWRRRCGFFGCRRGWRGRRGVRAGDVLAGVAIVGGIAAIASAANNNRRRDRDVVVVERDNRYDRDRQWREDNQQRQEIEELRRRTDEQQREIEYLRSRGLDARAMSGERARATALPPVSAPLTIEGAIDRCSQVVGIDSQVTSIDGVDRTGSGWSVRGQVAGQQSFSCQIGTDGQIQSLDNGGFSSNSPVSGAPLRAEGQWSDDRYADARAGVAGSVGGQRFAYAGQATSARPAEPLVPLTSDRMPAYPGGPVPGQ